MDAQASYRLAKGFEVYAQGLNLTNEVFGFYYGSPSTWFSASTTIPLMAGEFAGPRTANNDPDNQDLSVEERLALFR